MNKYKCTYEYAGMETEGAVIKWDEEIIPAPDKATAGFYYLILHGNKEFMSTKTLKEYKKSEYAEGGWGLKIEEVYD